MNNQDARKRLKPIGKLVDQFQQLESDFLSGDAESMPEMRRLLPRLLKNLDDLRSVSEPDQEVQQMIMLLPDIARLAIYDHLSPAERLEIFGNGHGDAEKYGFEFASAMFYREVGTSLQDLGRLNEAIEVLSKSVENFASIEEIRGDLGLVVSDLSTCLRECGRLLEAKQAALDAVRLLNEVEDTENSASALSSLGAIHYELGEMEEAEKVLLIAAERQQKAGMLSELAATHGNLSSVYSECGQHEKALEYAKRSLIQLRIDRNMPEIAIRLVNMASFTRESGSTVDALKIAKEAELIAKDFELSVTECQAIIEQADCQYELDRMVEACELLIEAERIGRISGSSQNVAAALSLHGRILVDLHEHESAIRMLSDARALFETAADRSGIAGVDHHLSIAYHAMGCQEKARGFAISSFQLYRKIPHRRADDVRAWAGETLGMTSRDFKDE